MIIFGALVGCNDIFILGKNPIKWRQRPAMAIAVDCEHRFKQTNIDLLVSILVIPQYGYRHGIKHWSQLAFNRRIPSPNADLKEP